MGCNIETVFGKGADTAWLTMIIPGAIPQVAIMEGWAIKPGFRNIRIGSSAGANRKIKSKKESK